MAPSPENILIGLGLAVIAKFYILYSLRLKVPKNAKKLGTVSRVTLFPLKSACGIELPQAQCTFNGLMHGPVKDRTWMVTFGEEKRFVTGRQEPRLTLIETALTDEGLVLTAPQTESFLLPLNTRSTCGVFTVKVWGESLEATDCGEKAAKWISDFLGKPNHRIVTHCDLLKKRKCIEGGTRWHDMSKEEDQVSFADGFPYMLMSEASVEDLNGRLPKMISINNFRPNIIATDCGAYDEDKWTEIYIGDAKFTNIKPCQRCIFTTVDPVTGCKDANMEPLKTLRSYRLLAEEFGDHPCFGINLVLDRPGTIKVGDSICGLLMEDV